MILVGLGQPPALAHTTLARASESFQAFSWHSHMAVCKMFPFHKDLRMYYLTTDGFFLCVFLSHLCSGQKTFTVEEAVETIGFGRFHIALFLIMGSTVVSACNRHHRPEEALPSFSLLFCNNSYNHHKNILRPSLIHIYLLKQDSCLCQLWPKSTWANSDNEPVSRQKQAG